MKFLEIKKIAVIPCGNYLGVFTNEVENSLSFFKLPELTFTSTSSFIQA